MPTTRSLVRSIGNGELACKHRDVSVCKECFAATPNLVEVYSVVYRATREDWVEPDGVHVILSPNSTV